jgi:hypothetical protein
MKILSSFFFTICLLNILNIINASTKSDNISNFEEGVYNIISVQKYVSISFNTKKELKFKKENLGHNSLNFRIKFIDSKSNIMTLQHLMTESYLGIEINKTNNENNIIILMNKEKYEFENTSFLFVLEEIEYNTFLIKSKLGCYLYENNYNILCSFQPNAKHHYFYLLRLFSEVDKENKQDLEKIEKEPIDVLIKYIDLSDPSLKREGIKQIIKDEQNEELRYCVRSILKNIPWVRKIFILMPNERVRFFKSPELINEKIIFVKDKDLLGYDSSNIHAFQFRLWKMKEFGMSDNFIAMDDDYFIGKPMNKSDFFYVQNNTVVPAIIATNYQVHTKKTFANDFNFAKNNLKKSRPQSSTVFMYSVYNTYSFFIDEFNSPIIVPYFTHNAIPINVKDLKEIYDLIYNSQYRNATLEALYRHLETLQFQTAVMVYTFNGYLRKVNLIKYSYIDVDNTINGNYNANLFCINTGGNKDYESISYKEARIAMNKLFPEPTPYEIINYTDIPYTSFQLIKTLEDKKNQINQLKSKDDKNENKNTSPSKNVNNRDTISKSISDKKDFINKYNDLSKTYRRENNKALREISILNENYHECISKKNYLESENSNFLQYEKTNNSKFKSDIENLKNELEKKKEIRKTNEIRKNIYINEINKNIKKLEFLENRGLKLYFIAIFEFAILIIILIIFFYLCFQRMNRKINNKKQMLLPII